KSALRRKGFSIAETPSPIVSLTPRGARDVERLSKQLLARRIYPGFIRYPGGAASGYFRFAISSAHRVEQLGRLVRVLVEFSAGTTRRGRVASPGSRVTDQAVTLNAEILSHKEAQKAKS